MTMTDANPKVCDVICRATVSAGAENVRRHLLALAKATLGLRGEFSLIYHLTVDHPAALPAGLAMYDRGPLADIAYATAATRAHIAVDLEDGADIAARTARLSALKQANVHILAEDGPAAQACFPPEALFTTPESLLDRVYALLGRLRAA